MRRITTRIFRMIFYIINGHEHEYETQTMIQVFLPNERYSRTERVPAEGMCVESEIDSGICSARVYKNGTLAGESFKKITGDGSREVGASIYDAFFKAGYGKQPWGLLTGIRPAKIAARLLAAGKTAGQAVETLENEYLVTKEKAELCVNVAMTENDVLQKAGEGVCVYTGVPFCPSRCLYCSFTSFPVSRYIKKLPEYFTAFEKETDHIHEYAKDRAVRSVYVGGGTPTSLPAEYLERLLGNVRENFITGDTLEFTVEAGRPDTVTAETVGIMKKYGVTRISVNPQTMNAATLEKIGRSHTPEDFLRAYETAARGGIGNINVDVILGLPGEKYDDVCRTFEKIAALDPPPKSVTVHTLAVKRASNLKPVLSEHVLPDVAEMERMLAASKKYCAGIGLRPYYMYRQKNMIGNFENVGYAKEGYECLYNVLIMEERHTVVSAGAGAVTKIIKNGGEIIKRVFAPKGVEEYIARVDEIIQEKISEGIN